MRFRPSFAAFLPLLLAVALVAGCAGREGEPARKAIDEIAAALEAAGPDATKYVPGKVLAVERQVTRFKVMHYDGQYDEILAAAPEVLKGAQNLVTDAGAKKAEIAKMLDEEWAKLAVATPEAIAAVRSRAEQLQTAKTLPAGVDRRIVETSDTGVAEFESLWQRANDARAAGNMEQAVTLASSAKRRSQVLLRVLEGKPES
jgi:hypothetical protein